MSEKAPPAAGTAWVQRFSAALLFVVAGVLLSSCPGSDSPDNADRDAAIYVAVLSVHLGEVSTPSTEPDKLPVVFVESFQPNGLRLSVQVQVVAALAENFDVRFIDDRDEATEPDLDQSPVRDGATLVGVGAVSELQEPTVRLEAYRTASDIEAFRYTLVLRNSAWEVVGSPQVVEPEGFGVAS